MKNNNKKRNCLITFVSLIFMGVIILIIHFAVYGSLSALFSARHIFGFSFNFPILEIVLWLTISFILFGILDTCLNHDIKKSPKKITALILAALIVVAGTYYVSISGFSFSDNGIKFKDDGGIFKTYSAQYDDTEIYRVKGYKYHVPYPGNQLFDYYEYDNNAYVITDGKGHYFEFGEISPSGKIQSKLNEIVDKYNKQIKTINSVEELWDENFRY